MKLTLIRHTSVNVEAGVCYGQSDVPLKDSFPQEAAIVKEKVLQLPSFEAIYSSPMSRCTLLAEYCGCMNVVQDSRLLELNFGDWEMQKYGEIKDPHLQKWFDNYLEERCTHGESFRDQLSRVDNFIQELKKKNIHHALAFTHGGVIVCAKILAGVTSMDTAFQSALPYGGIITLDY